MKTLIATLLITTATTSVFANEHPIVYTDAYTLVSSMAKTDIAKFAKFSELVDGKTVNVAKWNSIDSDYKLNKPSYKVAAGKFYEHNGHICSDLVVEVTQGGTVGLGDGTMCKSGESWIVLEK
jgi:hypothetical protein